MSDSEIYRPAIARAVAQSALWRTAAHEVIRQNETLTTVFGATLNSQWESSQIWRDDGGRLGELRWIVLRYQAEVDAEVDVQASADGGANWIAATNPTPTLPTTPEQGSDTVRFHFFGVVGHNIVFRVIFPSDETALILKWVAEVAVRSEWEYSHLV